MHRHIQELFASPESVVTAKTKQSNAQLVTRKKASEFEGVSKTSFLASYWKNKAKSKDNWPELVQKPGARSKDLFKDSFMTHFVDPEIGDEAERLLDKKMWLPMATRTRFFRRTISQAVKKQEVKQVILLGGGLDTLAVRKKKYSELFDVKFFEVDQANILNCKQDIYKQSNLHTNAKYIKIDYVKEDLITHLREHEVDFSKPTIILWEGNTFYLEKEDVIRILQNLAQQFSNLIITFDYMHPALSTNQQVSTIKTMREEFTKRQSPLKTFFKPEELLELCDSLGLQLVDHKTAAELATEYEVDQEPYVTASMYHMVTCSK